MMNDEYGMETPVTLDSDVNASVLIHHSSFRIHHSKAALAAYVRHLDLLHFHRLRSADLRIAIAARSPDGACGAFDFAIARTFAQQRAQIVPGCGEETGIELALGRNPCARAVPAER